MAKKQQISKTIILIIGIFLGATILTTLDISPTIKNPQALIVELPKQSKYVATVGSVIIYTQNTSAYVVDKAGNFLFSVENVNDIDERNGILTTTVSGSKRFISLTNFTFPVDKIASVGKNQDNISLTPCEAETGQWGYTNSQGVWIFEPAYSYAGNFKEGLAYVNTGGFSPHYFLHEDGTLISLCVQDIIGVKHNFSEGFLIVQRLDNQSNTYVSFLSKENTILNVDHRNVLQDAKPFCDGLAPIKIANKWGYINTLGKIVIEPLFANAFPFESGYAIIENSDGSHYIIDTNGKMVDELFKVDGYEYAGESHNGLYKIASDSGVNLCDRYGTLMFTRDYNYITWVDPCWIVENGDPASQTRQYICYFPQTGITIASYKYIDADCIYDNCIVIGSALYDCTTGSRIFSADFIDNFHEGLALAKCDSGLYGYINSYGQWVIEPQFTSAYSFQSGLAFVTTEDQTGLITNPLTYGDTWSNDEVVRAKNFGISFSDETATTFLDNLPTWFQSSLNVNELNLKNKIAGDHSLTFRDLSIILCEISDSLGKNTHFFIPPLKDINNLDQDYVTSISYLTAIGMFQPLDFSNPARILTSSELNIYLLRYFEALSLTPRLENS